MLAPWYAFLAVPGSESGPIIPRITRMISAVPPPFRADPPPLCGARIALRAQGRRALTLIEVLTALTVALVFIGGVATAMLGIIRASDEAEAEVRATATARSAVDRMATELRQLQPDADRELRQFRLINRPLAYGDNIDNDGDGLIDEEILNGRDDDGDWMLGKDRHVTVGLRAERNAFVGRPDLGDEGVDEDCRFSADEVSWVVPGTGGNQRIGYRLGTFDGEDHVLLRVISQTGSPDVIEPVVFEVVSLDILAWNANSVIREGVPFIPTQPYWVEEWNSIPLIQNPDRFVPGVNPPRFPDGTVIPTVEPFYFPTALYIRVTVNAERVPLSEIPSSDWPQGDRPLKTVGVSTVVNIESVMKQPAYDLYVRN